LAAATEGGGEVYKINASLAPRSRGMVFGSVVVVGGIGFEGWSGWSCVLHRHRSFFAFEFRFFILCVFFFLSPSIFDLFYADIYPY